MRIFLRCLQNVSYVRYEEEKEGEEDEEEEDEEGPATMWGTLRGFGRKVKSLCS